MDMDMVDMDMVDMDMVDMDMDTLVMEMDGGVEKNYELLCIKSLK